MQVAITIVVLYYCYYVFQTYKRFLLPNRVPAQKVVVVH